MADPIDTSAEVLEETSTAIEAHDPGTVCAVCGVQFPAAIAALHARACSARVRADDAEETRVFVDAAEGVIADNAAFARTLKRPANRLQRTQNDGAKVVNFFKRILFP